MKNFVTNFIYYLIAFIIFAIFYTVEALVISILWNYVVPTIFGLPTIDLWQSLVILSLCTLLFKTDFVNLKVNKKKGK